VTRELYDDLRDPQTPTSETLMRRHRASWVMVCRIAGSLLVDGAVLVHGRPWIDAHRGRPGTRRRGRRQYTQEDCLDAIRACAAALGESLEGEGWLSVRAYMRWSGAARRRARELGLEPPRLPCDGVIYRLWKTWPRSVEAAKREVELQDAA
jgi:hypothetical protein